MNLKQRFSLLFSTLFSFMLALVMLLVYSLFANFRVDEFRDRLEEKARTTAKLLVEVQEVDYQMLRIIDRNSIYKLHNEKIVIFNDSLQLIYSNIDDVPLTWTDEELQTLRRDKIFFRKNSPYDVFGMDYQFDNKSYYVLISSEDKYGRRKLLYLKYLLISATLIGSAMVWLLSFYVSKKALNPLDLLRQKIQDITDKNLNTRLPENRRNDEIGLLSKSFNQMLERIGNAYNNQKSFTANASHELRTPVARIVTQLENLRREDGNSPIMNEALKRISDDSFQLSDIISSLLLLSKIEKNEIAKGFQKLRLDEVVFYSAERITKLYPDFKLHFDINAEEGDIHMEVMGDETLLGIAIGNLFKNGYDYSNDGVVYCTLKPGENMLQLFIVNKGPIPEVEDTTLLFNTFTRGSNTNQQPGSGLGLSIVQRILHHHNANVVYNIIPPETNELIVTFYV